MTSPQKHFTAHQQYRDEFIIAHGGVLNSLQLIGEDWSARRYFRVSLKTGATAIVMETLPKALGGGGAGHQLHDYIHIAGMLTANGLHAPKIFAADEDQGYAIIEDMGDISFRTAPIPAPVLYECATDVLIHVRDHMPMDGFPNYFDGHIHTARVRVVDWYMPAALGRMNGDNARTSYLSVIDDIQKSLPSCPQGFVHGDFHLGNMMWCANVEGIKRCGLLDFQGGMVGPLAYDLVNLLGDAQGDVADDIVATMRARYVAGLTAEQRAVFDAWYQLLSVHFHGRVIGQVIKLALRSGKPQHLKNIPRLQGYLKKNLCHDMFKPLATWFKDHGVTFDETIKLDGAEKFIRGDAV